MKLSIKRILLGTLSVLLCALPIGADAYFEHTYGCSLEEDTIQVSLTTGEQLCLDYMAGLSQLLYQTLSDIASAQDNILDADEADRVYRTQVLITLNEKKSALTNIQQQIVLAMKDFEQELFVRVKGVVGYYLFSHTNTLEKKTQQGKNLLTRLVIAGNKEQYLFVRNQMDEREREMIFLERIKNSSNFASLLPPLKRRISLQEVRE